MSYLLLSLLGGFEATIDAEPVTGFVTNKDRALLAFLAIEAFRPHRRAELAAMLWPDASEKKAAHSLSQSLLHLRKALGGEDGISKDFLLVTFQDVQFNSFSDYHIDVARFRELVNLSDRHNHTDQAKCEICHKWLQEAASLYQGDLLSGLSLPNCEKFEEWRLVKQEDLHHQALEVLEQLAYFDEQRGEWGLVQEYSHRQIGLEPWRETAHHRLMRALVQAAQTSSALKQYDIYRQILTDELGLEPSGEIRRYYEQIRSGKASPAAPKPAGESVWLPGPGERRQVTTLVCSRIRPMELEEGPEQELACERYCEPIFKRFGGRRALRQGASCLVYFGYPQAFEDSARRAVHSGLAMASAHEGTGVARIGIHTGLMFVGEGRSPRWQDRDLSGLSLDIARDCQRWAQPGQVLITETTLQLVQDAFKVEEFPIVLPVEPGKNLPIFRVEEELGQQSRLDWLAETQRLTPFTGRKKEFSQLEACYEELLQGQGRVVLIHGGPGIGKSRLLWQLKQKVEGDASQHDFGDHRPVLWLEIHCLPRYQNTNLYPIVVLLEQLVGIQADDNLDTRRDKLKGILTWYGMNRPATLWLLSNLLGLQTEEQKLQTVTSVQREQMRQACLELLQKRATEHPFVLVIEDLHWSDPSTIEWIDQSFETLASPPCLVLLTARPEFSRKWETEGQSQPDLQILNLDPLAEPDVKDLVQRMLGDTQLEEGLYQHILAHTDGVPLYIEELTKALLEHPVRQRNDPEMSSKLVSGIPVTLQDSLMARLDALGTAKETAQWASVLGREFELNVLRVCIPFDEARLQDDMARLIQAELITPVEAALQETISIQLPRQPRRKRFPKTTVRYSFKHALLQDAIYLSLLKRTRQEYHRHVAETMEEKFPQTAQTQPELVAQHYFDAGQPARAADLWLRAGNQATAQGATLEARAFFDRVLKYLEPTDLERRWAALVGREHVFDLRVERDAQKKDIDMLLGLANDFNEERRLQALQLEIDYAMKRRVDFQSALPVAEDAIVLSRKIGNIDYEVRALAGKLQILLDSGAQAAAYQTVDQILSLLPGVKENVIQAYALGKLSIFYLHEGNLSRAVPLMQQGAQAASHAGDYYQESRFLYNIAFAHIQMGLYEQALTITEEVTRLAESRGDQQLTTFTSNLSYLYWCLGNQDRAITLGEQTLLKLRTAAENPYRKAGCLAYLGYFLESAGEWQRAAAYLKEAQEIFTPIGDKSLRLEQQVMEARCLAAVGRLEEAKQLAADAWSYIQQHGTVGTEIPSRVYRCMADVAAVIEVPGIASVREVIEAGYLDLMERTEKISNAEWRKSFLENVAENQQILERWKEINDL